MGPFGTLVSVIVARGFNLRLGFDLLSSYSPRHIGNLYGGLKRTGSGVERGGMGINPVTTIPPRGVKTIAELQIHSGGMGLFGMKSTCLELCSQG